MPAGGCRSSKSRIASRVWPGEKPGKTVFMPTFAEVRDRLRMAPARFRVTARVARTSGMMWNWTAAALREATRSLLKDRQSPSQVYRLHAANAPDKTAVIWRDQKLTFRELDDRLDRIGHTLQQRGLARGDRVVIMMHNRPEFMQL